MDVSSLAPIETNPNIASFKPGDTVKVATKLKEGDRETVQSFQGVVIRIRRGGNGTSFTVRRSIYGIGAERTFFFRSPTLQKVEVVQRAKVRRAKLYYLRDLSARQIRAKLKSKSIQETTRQQAPSQPPAPSKPSEPSQQG